MNVALATATTSAIAHHRAHAPLTRCRDDRRADDVDDIITVDEAAIADATKLIWGRMKLCIEPSAGDGDADAGADLAAKYPPSAFPNVGVILCGGNLDLKKAAKTLFA